MGLLSDIFGAILDAGTVERTEDEMTTIGQEDWGRTPPTSDDHDPEPLATEH